MLKFLILIFLICEIKSKAYATCNAVINEFNPVSEKPEKEFIELKLQCSNGGEKKKSLKDYTLIAIEHNNKGNVILIIDS